MAYGAVSVTSVATLIIAGNCSRKEIILTNNSDDKVIYLGMDANVTVNNGTPCYENQTRGHTKDFGTWYGPIWGIVASGTGDMRYWETDK